MEVIVITIALVSAFAQYKFYKFTKRKFTMVFMPVVSAALVGYVFVVYSDVSIKCTQGIYILLAFYMGIPIAIASSTTGIIIAVIASIKNKKTNNAE